MRKAQGPLIPAEVAEGMAALNAAGDAVSSTVDKVKGVFKPPVSDDKDTSALDVRQLFSTLANSFQQLGAKNPTYTNADSLMNLVGEERHRA